MKLISKIIITAAIVQTLASCAFLQGISNDQKEETPIDYLSGGSSIDIKNFFSGDLEGFAIMQDAEGNINKSYTTKITGKWEENHGTVQYNYLYSDGKKDNRTWLITVNDSSHYSAIGHDFIETAHGRNLGNASILNYSLNTIYADKKQRVDFEDKIYLVNEKSAILVSIARQDGDIIGKAIISLKKN